MGNAGFSKLDFAISPRNNLVAAPQHLALLRDKTMFFSIPPARSPPSASATTARSKSPPRPAALSLTSGISPHLVSHLRAQFSRDLQQSSSNTGAPLTKITNTIDGFGRSSILPRQTHEHRSAPGRNPKPRSRPQLLEVRRRRPAHHDLQFLSFAFRRRVHLRPHQGEPVHLRAASWRPGTDAAARLRPRRFRTTTSRISARQSPIPTPTSTPPSCKTPSA